MIVVVVVVVAVVVVAVVVLAVVVVYEVVVIVGVVVHSSDTRGLAGNVAPSSPKLCMTFNLDLIPAGKGLYLHFSNPPLNLNVPLFIKHNIIVSFLQDGVFFIRP